MVSLGRYEVIDNVDIGLFGRLCKEVYIVIVIFICCVFRFVSFCVFRSISTDDAKTHYSLSREGCNVWKATN